MQRKNHIDIRESPLKDFDEAMHTLATPTTSVTQDLKIALDSGNGKPNKVIDIPTVVEPTSTDGWGRLGTMTALGFGLGTAIGGAIALASLATGVTFAVEAIVLCTSSFYANFRMTEGDITKMLRSGITDLYKKDEWDGIGSPYISNTKKVLLTIGLLLSVLFAVTFGAFTLISTLALPTVFPVLAALPAFVIPLLAIVISIAYTYTQMALMGRGFAVLIKTNNLWSTIATQLDLMFGEKYTIDDGVTKKTVNRSLLDRGVRIATAAVLVGAMLGLILYGKTATLANCAISLNNILDKVPQITGVVAASLSFVIARVCALAAQIPFLLKVTLTPVVWLFSPAKPVKQDAAKPVSNDYAKACETSTLMIAAALSSGAASTIAMKGEELNFWVIVAGIGAFFDGFLSNTVNALINDVEEKHTERAELPPHPSTVISIEKHNSSAKVVVASAPEESVNNDHYGHSNTRISFN